MPATLLSMAMRPFRSYMQEQTGLAGEVVRGGDAFGLAKQLHEGNLQVGIFHGHEYAWAREKYPNLKPIVVCISQYPTLRAVLVVPEKSKATGNADLKGRKVAIPRDSRAHCRIYLERNCVEPGICPTKYYRLSRPSETEDALDDIASGKLEGAVVDAAALERYRKAHPARARSLRSLQESESFPPGVIAYYGGRLGTAEVKKLRAALVAAKEHAKGRQTLNLMRMSNFEPASEDYEVSLQSIVKLYPAPATGK
jgi:ABC-type phosphate/phosphonate transport system substrate-binding protein